ncbi:MAG: SprT-like domain-containing protein [Bacteroidetes bacterium]|nr:SprT-like domain-containing protein [Bacteroidota bacterium]MBU1580569.1 SprT-like domain-containing protein [Bacteroidota bacterium]MBU2558719.1 SprT-like domain-containing protein [Bacteroidota bacterium]
MKADQKEILSRFLPEGALEKVCKSIDEAHIHLRITAARSSRLGDFRPPKQVGDPYRISLNHNLNPYQFLITFVHELAHLEVYKTHKNKVQPHGVEWKQRFRQLMQPYLESQIFPAELSKSLSNYLQNAKAASGSDLELTRKLKQYNKIQKSLPTIEELSEGSVFRIASGRSFIKGARLRKRYKCQCVHSKRWYLFNPLAEVMLAEQIETK